MQDAMFDRSRYQLEASQVLLVTYDRIRDTNTFELFDQVTGDAELLDAEVGERLVAEHSEGGS